MSTCDEQNTRLGRLYKKISAEIKDLGNAASPASAIEDVKQSLQEFDSVYQMYKLETHMNDLPADAKKKHRKLQRVHQRNLTSLNDDLERAIESMDRGELMGGASASVDVSNKSAQEQLEHATKTAQDTTDTARNILRTINDTKEIGVDALDKLNKQTEQLNATMDGLVGMEVSMAEGARRLGRIARSQASEPLTCCLIFLLLTAIVACIGAALFGGGGSNIDQVEEDLNSLVRRL